MSKMEIVENFENKLLNRRQIVAKETVSKSTISRKDAKASLAKLLKVSEDLIIIKEIKSVFGSLDVMIEANVYDSKELLEKNARPHLIKRNLPKKEKEEKKEGGN